MDRETIAYLLIVILALAVIATAVFAYWNTPKRRYKRRMKQHQTKLHGE